MYVVVVCYYHYIMYYQTFQTFVPVYVLRLTGDEGRVLVSAGDPPRNVIF